jgi:hypothetical protein
MRMSNKAFQRAPTDQNLRPGLEVLSGVSLEAAFPDELVFLFVRHLLARILSLEGKMAVDCLSLA